MASQLPRFARPQTGQQQPAPRPFNEGSVTALPELVPIFVASGKRLEGRWRGPKLDTVRVQRSMFGGLHYKLKLGYMAGEGEEVPAFKVHLMAALPVTAETDSIDYALMVANNLLDMVNIQYDGPHRHGLLPI